MHKLTVPISDQEIQNLHAGDIVSLNGIIVTARDAAHKFMIDNFIEKDTPDEELSLYKELQGILNGGVIYHCGPVVSKKADGSWKFVAAGPTTSIREEKYEYKVIEHFKVKAVIGKGGMGPKTLEACRAQKAVYLHAVGGAASLIAASVKEVVDVYKVEFGLPEAFWKIRVEDFQAVVTMDAHGKSLHEDIDRQSSKVLNEMLG